MNTFSLGGLFKNTFVNREYEGMREDILNFNSASLKSSDMIDKSEYVDLHSRLTDFMEDHNLPDEWEYHDEVSVFLSKYKDLTDNRKTSQKIREIIEQRAMFSSSHGYDAELSAYYPEEYNKLVPKRGCWIMILIVPMVQEQYRPHLYGVYYAMPEWVTSDIVGKYKVRRLKAKINTEAGEVMMLPHEYTVVKDISDVISGVGHEYEIVKLGGTSSYDADKVYYLLTRGVPVEVSYQLLMGDIGSINFQYFRIRSEAFEAYDFLVTAMQKGITYEMAQRLWHHKCTGTPLFIFKETKHGQRRSE